MEKLNDSYILGTEWEELHRLGLQHQVWASEARTGWSLGGFTQGQTIIDLGCGPGYCTRELAYIAGIHGKVIGIDLSKEYCDFLLKIKEMHQLNIDVVNARFEDMDIADGSVDVVYCRWALAWVSDVDSVLKKLYKACKPGAKLVFHEYYDWSIFQCEPHMPALMHGVKTILNQFKDSDGEIDIGRQLPGKLLEAGFAITGTRPMAKLAMPDNLAWHWPRSFLQIYLPKLIELQLITSEQVDQALHEFKLLESIPGASILCPQLIEVIGHKE